MTKFFLVVLVTGASGYLAIHCIRLLLRKGYRVRGTVRDLKNRLKIQPLENLEGSDRLELVYAELQDAQSWIDAVDGCDYILHMASPCEVVASSSIIDDAVQGTLNVLKAAAQCPKVKKVVLTSSCGAVNEGVQEKKRIFDENDWTNLDCNKVLPYHRSKTMAEKAAWNFVNKHLHFKLTVLNPGLVVGPLLQNFKGASVIGYFMDFTMIMYPSLSIAVVDVDDVAEAHLRAMLYPESDGERILITSCTLSFKQIAKILRKEFGPKGYFVPKLQVPYILLRVYSIFSAKGRSALQVYGHEEYFDNSKAKRLLKMNFKDPRQALIDMTYDMIARGMLPRKGELAQRNAKRSSRKL
uniref:Epimerase domain-containing protein n=1 Tax=Syphacia muris TaxID=451379 RepID=A0A0N5AB35_9BILA